MSERKVLNKYFPPDFDPSKIPRQRRTGPQQQAVRLAAPYSMRCNRCGEYIYKGKKFNARKEVVEGETYYGVKILRFYIKCPQCSSEITFKTDPKNTDYAAEHGASRNFEPWRERSDEQEDDDPLARLEQEEESEQTVDPMKALEQRTLDSQREMEILDALQDIRTRNARMERVDTDAVLQAVQGKRKADEALSAEQLAQRQAEEEDEALVRQYFRREKAGSPAGEPATDAGKADVAPIQPNASGTSTQTEANDKDEPGKSGSLATPAADAQTSSPPASRDSVSVKLADPTGVPDARSLLSDAAREQLLSMPKHTAARPPAKKRRGPNALGLVKKA